MKIFDAFYLSNIEHEEEFSKITAISFEFAVEAITDSYKSNSIRIRICNLI